MPGRYRDTHPWPLFGLRITTPRLELRIPDDEDLVELFEAARAGIHPADEMPFGIPWTDGIAGAGRARRASSPSTGRRAARSPRRSWSLPFAVVADGRVVGTQELMAEAFPGSRSVSSGSWLTASAAGPRARRRDARRRAPPRVRRPRRARGADVGLDRQRGLAARLAAARLPARRRDADGPARRADAPPALPPHARGVAAEPLRRHRAARSRALPARCSGLHELAANLYNHATMATPTTETSRSGAASRRAERGHRRRIRLCRARARAPDRGPSAALAAHRAGALRRLRRARAGRARALRRRLPLPAPRRKPARSARRSRARARRSSTSAPTSGSIRTGPTG